MKTLPRDTLIREEREHLTNLEPTNGKLDIILKVSEARFRPHDTAPEDLIGCIVSDLDETYSDSEVHRTLEAKDFIYQHGLVGAYSFALGKIQELIPGVESIEISLKGDVDTDETWVKIMTHIDEEPNRIVEASGELLKQWAKRGTHDPEGYIRFHYKFSK